MSGRASLALLLLAGCGLGAPEYAGEAHRIRSPAGDWDAVVTTIETGKHEGRNAVLVVPAGEPIRGRYATFVADCLDGLSIGWRDAATVVIAVEKARIWDYEDQEWHYDADGDSRTIGVELWSKGERLLGGCGPDA